MAVFSGAVYYLSLDNNAAPGKKGVAKLLHAIGYNNVLIGLGVVVGLVTLVGLLQLIFRPRFTMFRPVSSTTDRASS